MFEPRPFAVCAYGYSGTSRRSLERSQGGFTLLELLVVIALLGILGGATTGTFQHLRTRAKVVALDESLRSLATAVQLEVLENEAATPSESVEPAIARLKNADALEFSVLKGSPDSAVVQVRYRGDADPCRQMELSGGEPQDCVGSAPGPVARPESAKAEEDAKHKAEEDAKHKAEEEAKRKAEEEAKRKAEEEAKRKAEEEAAVAISPEFASKITTTASKFYWWNKPTRWTKGEGAWVGSFTFSNDWAQHQYLDISIVRTDHSGKQTSSVQTSFYVPARGKSSLDVWDNAVELDAAGGTRGVESLQVTVTRVTTNAKDGKRISAAVPGPSGTLARPKIPA